MASWTHVAGEARALTALAETVFGARRMKTLASAGDEATRFSLFRLDVAELVVTRPDPETDLILVEWWNEASGLGRAVRQPG